MGQAIHENHTPFTFEALYLADEQARPLLVPVIKATYAIERDGLSLAPEQAPLLVAGEFWGAPETSGYRFEPECAFFKPSTDVVLLGHAHAPAKGAKEALVSLQVGPLRKVVRVLGDRVWYRSLGRVFATEPLPFETLPLRYERAFGGSDRSDPAQLRFEPRNPVGVGFRPSGKFEEGLRLPNLEDPARPLQRFGQEVPPACFGFTSPHWHPRAAFAGTYDERWEKHRKPLLPEDFDRRFFNAASPGLVAGSYLRGDEQVVAVGASPDGRVAFSLPGLPPPEVRVQLAEGSSAEVETRLDTVILDLDARRVYLLWRGLLALSGGPHDVRAIEVKVQGLAAPASQAG